MPNKRILIIGGIVVLFGAMIGGIVALAAVLATHHSTPVPTSAGMSQHGGGGSMGSGGSGNGGSGQGSSGGGMGQGGMGQGGMGQGSGNGGMGQGSGNGGMGQGAGGNGQSSGGAGGGAAGGGGKCSKTQTKCNGTCVDLQTSSDNCGSCGNSCGDAQTCTAGMCMCSSPMDVKNPGFESGKLSPWVFTSPPSGRAKASVVEGNAADSGSSYLKVQSSSQGGSKPIDFTVEQETQACPLTLYDFSFAVATTCAKSGCGACMISACFGTTQTCQYFPAPTKFTTMSGNYYTSYHTNRTVSVGTYGPCHRTTVSVDSIEVSEVKQELLDTMVSPN